MKLLGKKAIVTGANRNIGAEIARLFAEEGADVCISYRSDHTGAEEVREAIIKKGRRAKALHVDFSNESEIDSFFKNAVSFLGGVDILVNNAAGYDTSAFLDLPIETFKELLSIGVSAPMLMTQLAARHMIDHRQKGAIINISSISGLRVYANRVAHSTAKAALNMLTQNTAIGLAEYGIRVNAIAPGPVPYDINDAPAPEIPLGRYGKPEDIAKTALFLASDDSEWMTGQILVVDGGLSTYSKI